MCVITGTAIATSTAITSAMVAADVAIIASIATIATQVAAANAQGEAAQKQAEYQAQVAEYEATVARQEGNIDQVIHGINARREYGKLINAQSASSSDLAFGTPLQTREEARLFHAFDSDIIARNTQARVTGLRLQAEGARSEGRNIRNAYTYQAIGAGVSGLARIASIGTNAARSGTFDPIANNIRRNRVGNAIQGRSLSLTRALAV